MKGVVDVKSLFIGVLATVLFFTIVGAKSKNNANFDTITAKSIKIVNPEGKTVAFLGSFKGKGLLDICNEEGKHVVRLISIKGGGVLDILNKEGKCIAGLGTGVIGGGGVLGLLNKEGKPVVGLSSEKEGGELNILNKEGKAVVRIGSLEEGGALEIYNKYGKEVATVQADKKSDGGIFLFDRYGNLGWTKTGKK